MSSAIAPDEGGASLPLAAGRTLEAWLERALELVAALLVALEMVLLLATVFARYVLTARSHGPTSLHPSSSFGSQRSAQSSHFVEASTCA
jgi:hypothetical protein